MANPEVIWKPHPGPQTSFLSCPYPEVFYGGQVGGGKSDCLLVDALGQITNPAYRGLILRRSYPELKELIGRSKLLYPKAFPGARYRGDEKLWTFPSGATIEFGYLQYEDDKLRYQGQQYSWVGFDELTHFTEDAYLYLHSRVRAPITSGLTTYVRATGNPGGRGHAWVKARFVDAGPPNTPIVDPRTGQTRIFIPSGLKDNPSLAATDYADRLNILGEADRKALLLGDWSAYEGSVFVLERGIHIWTWQQFCERTGHERIPEDWLRYRTMDWGFARPYAIHWYATDYENRAFVYRERYGVKTDGNGTIKANEGIRLEPTKVAQIIADVEADTGEHIAMAWTGPDLDSAGRGDTTMGIKLVEHFIREGVVWSFWTAGPGSRKSKKQALHERLAYEKDPETGEILQWPGLIFIEEECPHVIRTLPSLEYDPARGGEDVDTTAEDHAYDSIAGFCLMRPWATKLPISERERMWPTNRKESTTWLSR